MDIEAHMVILFVSYKTKQLKLLMVVQIHKCQNQKMQIPIVVVYEVQDVPPTKNKHNSSVTDNFCENRRQPF